MQIHLGPRIIADPDILAGEPVVEGTQVAVAQLVADVAAGKSLDEVAHSHGIATDDVRAALEFAARRAAEPPASLSSQGISADEAALPPVDPSAIEDEARRLGLDPTNLTPLGRRLLELRMQGIASGEPRISSWEELDAEIADRRGGVYPDADA